MSSPSILGEPVPGTTDSHVDIECVDFDYLRSLGVSLTGSWQLLGHAVPAEVLRLEQLGLVQLIGGRVCITGRGVCAIEAEPIGLSGSVVTFRGRDLR